MCLLALVALVRLAPAARADSGGGPVLTVAAHLDPVLSIQLSDTTINFSAVQPGLYDADKTIDVKVATNYGSWTLSCLASPLVGTAGQIPSDRLFISDHDTLGAADRGAGAGFENMGEQRLIATGGPQALAVVNTLAFRLLTNWTDRPGQYAGTLSFTYLASP